MDWTDTVRLPEVILKSDKPIACKYMPCNATHPTKLYMYSDDFIHKWMKNAWKNSQLLLLGWRKSACG